MRTNEDKKNKLIEVGILSGAVIVLQLLSIHMRIGQFSISLILIPIVIGAVLRGPLAGAWLGFLFGTVLNLTGETAAFWAVSPLYTIIDTVLRGAAVGIVSGCIYETAKKRNEGFAIELASISAPMVNTGIFITLTPLLFWDMSESLMGEGHVFAGMIENYVGINFFIELALNMALTPAIIRITTKPGDQPAAKKEGSNRRTLATRLTAALIMLGILICIVTSISGKRNDESIVMVICVEIIFITLYSYFISFRVIMPIKSISEEVSGFVMSENKACNSIDEIHTHDEIQQLAEDIVKMENDIGNYISDITRITAEKERIQTELNVATKIQADMLPSNFAEINSKEGFNIYASMSPAKEVGGDFYDFFMVDEDHLALVIGDVSDKGVPAALFMVVAKTLIKNQVSFTTSPKKILEAVNNQLCDNNTSRMFVTVWLCIYEISTGHCVAANAGHEYPAVKSAGGGFELLKDSHGFVLGGVKNCRYSEYEFTVENNGAVFVYTDGVTEAENEAHEMFGTEKLICALNSSDAASSEERISGVRSVIESFVKDAPQFDDITMLCISRD